MITKCRAALFLLVMLPACQLTPSASVRADRPSDPRLAHAREAQAWLRFDDNLEMLYRARRIMREGFLLPEKPALENSIQELAWATAEASERHTLAGMIAQEAESDLEHCRQALELAETRVVAAREKKAEALGGLTSSVLGLREALLQGDVEANLRSVETLTEGRHGLYMGNLRDIGAAVRAE